jgi:hypothetical protein
VSTSPLGQISYRQGQEVVLARRRADEQKSNVHLAPPLSSAFPIVWTAPSAWLPRANILTFNSILHGLDKELNHCEEKDRDSIYKQRGTAIDTQNVNTGASKVLSSREIPSKCRAQVPAFPRAATLSHLSRTHLQKSVAGRGSVPAMISTGPHPLSAQVAEVFTTSYLLSPPESPQTSLLPQR